MNDVVNLIIPLFAGIILGVFFFLGLWFTVQFGLRSKNPAFIFSLSLILRVTLVLWGFYLVGAGEWNRILACLAGFIIARSLIKRFTNMGIWVDNILKKDVKNET